ncbi:hypothetical protein [Asanoa sp. NPDC050611]|uniref:hypothetical protein n=1 Tax=Asanoa sp. NPDC050611 TaxID=3157098 RepID=UPI0033C1EDE8
MLDEPRTDRVRDAFAELTGSIDPFLTPPGVDSVHSTVRRRRQRLMGGVAAAAVAVAAVAGLAQLPAMEQPAPVVADRPQPAHTLPPTALTPPLAPPAALSPSARSQTAAGGATATKAPVSAGDGDGRATTPPAAAQQGPAACVSTVRASADGSNLVVTADTVCPGETIAVSWVTYEAQRDGSQQLFANEQLTLTEARKRVVTTLRESPTCVGPWYVLRGKPSIPATIGAEQTEPFPDDTVLASEDGELCLN